MVRAGGLLRERSLATLRQVPTFSLIVSGQDQPLVTQQPQHGRLRNPVPFVGRVIARTFRWLHAGGALACFTARSLAARPQAAATGPSAVGTSVLGLASAASYVRACQSVWRTSKSTCPRLDGSPRGPRSAQARLRTPLPHPDLDSSFTSRLSQLTDFVFNLLLPG